MTELFVSFINSDSVSAYSLTMSTSGSLTANVLPDTDGGIGTTVVTDNVSIASNCRAGYTLTIAGPTDNNLYLNGDSTNNTSGTYFTPVDGTSALNTSTNANKWGYSLTANSRTGVFSALSNTPATLKTPSQTASPDSDIDTTIPVYYGTSVNNSMAPGSYTFSNSASITYTAVMDASCMVVNIAYDGNNADAGTMAITHNNVTDGSTVDLVASNFSRSGYGFAGWSTDSNAGAKLLDNDNTNNPVVYGPNETVTLPVGFYDLDTDNDGVVKLYAVWLQSQGSLQGWTGCANLDTATYDSTTGALDLTKNNVTALTDQRDNDTYAVARLADGECWMIENLRLDADATTGNNATDSTVTNEFLSQGYGKSATYGDFVGLATAESSGFTSTYSPNSLYSNDGTNNTINIGTSNYPGSRMPRYNNVNTSSRASSPTDGTGAMYSYGNYYTWSAAMANTISYTSPTTTDADGKTSETVNTSLCPAGWKLPYGRNTGNGATSGGFSYLDIQLGGTGASQSHNEASNRWRRYPNNFLYSGSFSPSSAGSRGSGGLYWSSTARGSNGSYVLVLYKPNVSPGTADNIGKAGGISARCVASDQTNYTLSYNANGGSSAPSSQTLQANGSATFTVSNTIPTRSGYTFTGWMDEKGNEVQPGGTFRTKDTNAVLYAIWTNNSCNPTATTIGTGNASTDAVCLQDVKPSMKASLPTADSTTGTYNLIDARDGQTYTVAKLADGNLWLTKNLNYGSNTDTLLTPYDTDLPTNTSFKAPASTTDFETTNSAETYISPKILTDSTYGGYYSYAAAIASTNAYSVSGQNISTSICPKGWDLPTSSQYNNLRTVSGNTSYATMSVAPYSFIYAGYRNGTSFTNQTSTIRLWTSTNSSSGYAYYTTAYGTANYDYKRYGNSIRCIASNGTVTINYDGNGTAEYPVTGTVASQINVEINSTNTQPGTTLSRTGWTFNGWNTSADGTGTAIAADASIANLNPTPNSTITLYAQWIPYYAITYVNNCMSWASNDTNCTQAKSNNTSVQEINLDASGDGSGTLGGYNKFTMTGWKIKEWTTNANGSGTIYPISSTYSVTGANAGDGITLYAHWIPTYVVQYDGNGSDNDSTGMGSTDASTGLKGVRHTNVGEGDTFTLFASNFKRTGYGFVGWSADISAWSKLVDNDVTNDAKIWGPNEVFVAPAYGGNPIYTLYAVWAPAETNGGNPVYLQNWTGCSAMTATTYDDDTGTLSVAKDSITALTDQRDNDVYAIAKLADGNCWMIENLRLDAAGTVGNNINDSSVTNQSLSQGYGGAFVGLADPEPSSSFSNSNTGSNSLYNTTIITGGYLAYRFPRYNDANTTWNNNDAAAVTPTLVQSIPVPYYSTGGFNNYVYSYGNSYTWAAAAADTTEYPDDPSSTTNESYSICPAGWRLPHSNSDVNMAFIHLYIVMGRKAGKEGSKIWRSFPNNFVLPGGGWSGTYWSNRSSGSDFALYLNIDTGQLQPGWIGSSKCGGKSVRCVTPSS